MNGKGKIQSHFIRLYYRHWQANAGFDNAIFLGKIIQFRSAMEQMTEMVFMPLSVCFISLIGFLRRISGGGADILKGSICGRTQNHHAAGHDSHVGHFV
jgi:hypothetical protein